MKVVNEKTPKEIEGEVRAQLEPLLSNFYTGSKMYKAYYGYLEQLSERLHRGIDFVDVVKRTEEVRILHPKARTALVALLYLMQTEVVGTGYVDMAILLLIAKGLPLHLEPDHRHRYTRHAASPRDLDSPSLTLAVKLNFLTMNGLSFFENFIDRELRNDIAHADFEIDDDGKFFRPTKSKGKEVDMVEKLLCFSYYIEALTKVFVEQSARVAPPPK